MIVFMQGAGPLAPTLEGADPRKCEEVVGEPDRWRDIEAGRLTGCTAYDGGVDNFWVAAAWSILPTIVVSGIFVIVLRGILRFDRTERRCMPASRPKSAPRAVCPPSRSDATARGSREIARLHSKSAPAATLNPVERAGV
jgi:hypothetical protein